QQWHNIRPNEEEVYYLAAMHLIRQGHRRLGLISPPQDTTGLGILFKHQSMERTLHETGIREQLSVCLNVQGSPQGEPNAHDAQHIANWLCQPDAPTCVIEHIERMSPL